MARDRDWRSEIHLVGGDVEAVTRTRGESAEGAEDVGLICILGDLGRAASGDDDLARRRFASIDRDDFDGVLVRHDVQWAGALQDIAGGTAGVPVALSFRALDDFHPDRIVERIEPLHQLLALRRALDDPSRFDTAAEQIRRWLQPETAVVAPADEPARPAAVEVSPAELLDQILGGGGGAAGPPVRLAKTELQEFLQDIVRPHLVGIDTRRQAALTEAVDDVLSAQVRAVLHDARFQRTEAMWRGLKRLVSQVETGSSVQIRVLHLTKDELLQEIRSGVPAEERVLSRLLVDAASVPGGLRPTVILGAYDFADTVDDLRLLAHLGAVAGQVGAPFVAAASPALLRCDAFPGLPSGADLRSQLDGSGYEEWHSLRMSAVAPWLALALPRLLCRVPYGAELEPIESFTFEEQPMPGAHEALLWGNPALAVGEVVGQAMATGGMADLSVSVQHVEGLPLYIYQDDGEAVTKPCAEVRISERVVEALADFGLVPLVSHATSDIVALPCLQSVASPRRRLYFRGQER